MKKHASSRSLTTRTICLRVAIYRNGMLSCSLSDSEKPQMKSCGISSLENTEMSHGAHTITLLYTTTRDAETIELGTTAQAILTAVRLVLSSQMRGERDAYNLLHSSPKAWRMFADILSKSSPASRNLDLKDDHQSSPRCHADPD